MTFGGPFLPYHGGSGLVTTVAAESATSGSALAFARSSTRAMIVRPCSNISELTKTTGAPFVIPVIGSDAEPHVEPPSDEKRMTACAE